MAYTFKRDYKNGMVGELEVLPRIKEFFKRDIQATTYKYDTYDFYDNEYKYELKTRTNNYNQYSTTLISTNKITDNNKIIFLFNFTDGLYYIEYEKELFDTFERKMYIRNARSDFVDTVREHLFIPIKHLLKIN
jgi:hypothetical protein